MSDMSKLALALGVKDDELWRVAGEYPDSICRVHNGFLEYKTFDGWERCESIRFLTDLINHPDTIIRPSVLTEGELLKCKSYNVKYLSRNSDSAEVVLWDSKPTSVSKRCRGGIEGIAYVVGPSCPLILGISPGDTFPSVGPGALVEVPQR